MRFFLFTVWNEKLYNIYIFETKNFRKYFSFHFKQSNNINAGKILNLKVQGSRQISRMTNKFLYRMSLMGARAWMIVAHFISWKRKWRRCSSFVQTLWILHTGRAARFVFWRSFTFSFHFASMMWSPISLITKVISIYPTYGAVVIGLLTACYTLPCYRC